ncbi:MAG: hypothetical protein CMJ18_19405 [Phycisphaeraceae bacterium]|nr:hypothetical protein [Phycisphaeraceae bacterium]
MRPDVLYVGSTPQYFVDNHVIEMFNFVTRTMHRPTPHECNPLIRKDRPWEVVLYFRTNTWNVYWDDQETLYKCWYEDLAYDFDTFSGRKSDTHGLEAPGFHEVCDSRYLYAESADGVHWEKPELGYRDVDGRRTNICLGNERDGKAHAASFLLDEMEEDPSKRFKVIFWNERKDLADAINKVGYSPDGRTWTLSDEPVTFGGNSGRGTGDVIIVNRNRQTGEYTMDTRIAHMCEHPGGWSNPDVPGWGLPIHPNEPTRNARRRIYYAYSRDFHDWTPPQQIMTPDLVEDNLDDEYYGLARFRLGDLWVGLLNRFHRTPNTMSASLVYSRDGSNWHHAGQRQPFLAPRVDDPNAWDRYMAECCCQPVFLDDEIRVYHAGSNFHHDWWQFGFQEQMDHPEAKAGPASGETALGLATLRPGGFVSLDSDEREGILITRPLASRGGELQANVQCRNDGFFRVALLDVQGNELSGYEKSACDTFAGDSTGHVVTWGGRSALPAEAMSRGVKVCFYSRRASLYSFRIV